MWEQDKKDKVKKWENMVSDWKKQKHTEEQSLKEQETNLLQRIELEESKLEAKIKQKEREFQDWKQVQETKISQDNLRQNHQIQLMKTDMLKQLRAKMVMVEAELAQKAQNLREDEERVYRDIATRQSELEVEISQR